MLVMTDYFSRYAQAFLTKNQTAKTAAWVLFDTLLSTTAFRHASIAIKDSVSSQSFSRNCVRLLG